MSSDARRLRIIVTGASSGIGAATARVLAAGGHRVIAAARRRDRLDALAAEHADDAEATGELVAAACDVADEAQVRALAEAADERFGGLDAIVNNAGVMPLAPMAKCRTDDWNRMLDVNVRGVLHGIAAALPRFLEQGRGHVVNVSSVAGRQVSSGAVVYCGTKHMVHAISEGLRRELHEMDPNPSIRVTVISPGFVTTELPSSTTDEKTRGFVERLYDSVEAPLTGEDVAGAIRYCLESPDHVDVNELCLRATEQVL